jgi:quercetin dioxygenase-like cupin family protein
MTATMHTQDVSRAVPDFGPFIDPERETEIVSSKSYMGGRWAEATKLKDEVAGVSKQLIPIDMSIFTARVVTTVAPGTHLPRHSHDGCLLRYVASGSLKLNGVDYATGDWIFVPAGADYEIETAEGYTAVLDYRNCSNCQLRN